MKCVAVPQLPMIFELSMSKWLGVETAKLTHVWSGKCFRYTDGRTFGYVHAGHALWEVTQSHCCYLYSRLVVNANIFATHSQTLAQITLIFFDAQMWLHMIPRTIFWLGRMFCSCRCRYDAYEFVCLTQMVFLQRFQHLFFFKCLLYVRHVFFWHIFTYMAWKCSHDQCNCTAIIVLSRFVLDWLQTHSCQQRRKTTEVLIVTSCNQRL